MTKLINCEECEGCKIFDGRNGKEVRPCHRPVPPDIPTPPLKIIDGPDITMSPSDYKEKPSWFLVWLFGLFLGISIGLLIAKSL